MAGTPWFAHSQYDFWEVISAFQKSIRRGLEDDALFWGTELWLGGAGSQAFNRLLIISVEDCGLANPLLHTQVKALGDSYRDLNKDEKEQEGRLYFVQAILLCVKSPKSRIVDHANITYFEGVRMYRPIPEWAKDVHTGAGGEMGRDYEHFFDEGAKLENCNLDDPYLESARDARSRQ